MIDAALAVLRVVSGGLLAGHGAQKVFGWFDGPGPEGTARMARALRLEPEPLWARAAGVTELAGGALTAAGALSPLGPVTVAAPMVMASTTAHWGRPIWAQSGGAELPVTNLAVAATLALAGPGRYSVDGVLGIRMPRALVAAAVVGTAAGCAAALLTRRPEAAPAPETAEQEPAQPETEVVGRRRRAGAAQPSG